MKQCQGSEAQTLILPFEDEKRFQDVISKHREEFLDYIHKLGLDIHSDATTTNNQIDSTTIITLKTTCFKVDFNDTFVKISHLKQPEN
jgi:hypothetical protein